MPSPGSPTAAEADQLVALFNARKAVELGNQARLLLERFPDSGMAWKALAFSLYWCGKDALPAWRRARELLPDDAETQNNLGVTLLNASLRWPSKNVDTEAPPDATRLKPLSMNGVVFNVVDFEKFLKGVQLIRESLVDKGATLYCADNLITWNKNYSFLRDEFYLDLLNDEAIDSSWRSIVWRTYVLLYFAEVASKADGDYAEFGCHTGHTAAQVISKVDLGKLKKRYFLYDLFEWKDGDQHTRLEGHGDPLMHEHVIEKFSNFSFVKIIKGPVPQSFSLGFPDQIAFAHVDMNHPDPEVGALTKILPNLSRGGIVILDDYGWWGYSAQKIALDPIIKRHGLKILELPTGQGLIIN